MSGEVAGFLNKILCIRVGLRGFCGLTENECMMGKTETEVEHQFPFHPEDAVVLNQREIPCVSHHDSSSQFHPHTWGDKCEEEASMGFSV